MSVTTKNAFSAVARGRLPFPAWLKLPLFGTILLGSVSAATWVFIIPHQKTAPAPPSTPWNAGRDIKDLKADVPAIDPGAQAVEPLKADLPDTTAPAPAASHVRLMQIWGSDSNTSVNVGRGGVSQRGTSTASTDSTGHATSPDSGGSDNSEYASQLVPTAARATEAETYQDMSMLLPRSKSFECLQDSPSDNQLAGDISCTAQENVWSADGSNILIDRLATVSGEITRGMGQGQDRGFILWTEVRSNHVHATLNSPAADQLGQMGVPGIVDEHWWQRIKAASLLTAIQTSGNVLQNLASKEGSSSINFSQGQSMANQALAHDLNIPTTLWRGQAWLLRVYIRHDVQFHRAYGNRFVAGMQ